jgi:hypothetical protein
MSSEYSVLQPASCAATANSFSEGTTMPWIKEPGGSLPAPTAARLTQAAGP